MVLLRPTSWRRTAAAATVLTCLIAPLSTDTVNAAVPSAGSVSATSPTATWTGGPFLTPNVTDAVGTPTCGAATPCDDFSLNVSTPAGYGTDHQLKVSIAWPNSAAEFDLYVLDAAGNVVTASGTLSDPQTVLLPPTSGSYTVRVVPFAPLGQSITGTATLEAKPPNPPSSTAPAPTYANYPAPAAFSGQHTAGEPSIGVDWKTGAVMYQSLTHTARVSFDDRVSPAAATWTDHSATPPNCTAVTSLDPILFTDHATGRTFESQLAGKTALTCYTDDDGATWTPTSGSGINSGVDHQTIGGGPFSASGVGGLPVGYPHAVYYCSQDIADALCASSPDGGLTYGPAVPMYSLLDCGGLHGHVKVAPDGTVYVPNKGCGGNQAVAVSEDNGLTWHVRKDPFSTPGQSDPSVGVGANGTLYMGYQNSDGTPRVAVSHDKGQTWQYDQSVGASLGIMNSVFPAVVAGDDNRAAFAFLGTTTPGNYQDSANFHGEWHLYIATTYDGGQTWVTADATPNDPVQKGSVCTAGTTCGQDRNLLDFMDATIDSHGRVLVGYADGCTGACDTTGGAQNYDALATIARQSSGMTLLSAYDPKADLDGENENVDQDAAGSWHQHATVTNSGTAPAQGVVVKFFDNGTLVGTSSPVDLAPGASTVVSVPWPGPGPVPIAHQLLAVIDPSGTIAQSDGFGSKVLVVKTL